MSNIAYKATKSNKPIKWGLIYSNKTLLLLYALVNNEKPSAINNYGISRPSNYIIELRKILKDKILTIEIIGQSYDEYRLVDSKEAREKALELIKDIKLKVNQKCF